MLESNTEEQQIERAKKEDIKRFLEGSPTRLELMNYLAPIFARLELLEMDSMTGLSSNSLKLVKRNLERTLNLKRL